MAVLEIKDLCVRKPKSQQLLVDNINVEVEAGEVLAIIGPNGAGKTSLLKAITGDMPYQGSLQINGASDKANLRARQCAFLAQMSILDFPFRVNEVVNLARIPHSSGKTRDQQIIKQALELLDIQHLAHRRYTALSGGEKQRVQLARVLAQIWDKNDAPNQTRLLILDEPTAALDLGHQRDLMATIGTFAQQGIAVVMVLHDLNLAAHYADKILALQDSKGIAYGKPEKVITKATIQTLFGNKIDIITHPKTQKPIVVSV